MRQDYIHAGSDLLFLFFLFSYFVHHGFFSPILILNIIVVFTLTTKVSGIPSFSVPKASASHHPSPSLFVGVGGGREGNFESEGKRQGLVSLH